MSTLKHACAGCGATEPHCEVVGRLRAENERLRARITDYTGLIPKAQHEDALRIVEKLMRQRDALLEAAKLAAAWLSANTKNTEDTRRLYAAIAACEESDDA